MKILIAGSSGFIGTELCVKLSKHDIYRLVRRKPKNEKEIYWDPKTYDLDPHKIDGFDAVIHLGGAGVADKIWTKKYKKILSDSRIKSTRSLCDAIKKCASKPKVYITSSGVNYYGSSSEKVLNENSPLGKSFLANLCKEWEDESKDLDDMGIRRVMLRTSIVLGKGGGMLAKLYPIFKFGFGGPIGLGQRHFPWISLQDMCSLIEFSLENKDVIGPVNAVAPGRINNSEFTKHFATHLHRPAFFPVPTPVFKLLPSEMVDDLFLCDLNIESKKLSRYDFKFKHPDIKSFFNSL